MAKQMSIPAPTPAEKDLLLKAQSASFSRSPLGSWILELALRQAHTMVTDSPGAEISEQLAALQEQIKALQRRLPE